MCPMTFRSILFERWEDSIQEETREAPDFFVDLNLDQVLNAITQGRQEYHLKPFFYMPLKDSDAIAYRHEIVQDLEGQELYDHIQSFAQRMRTMRKQLEQVEKLYYTYQKESWFVDAVETYCDAVIGLVHDLSAVNVRSRGLLAFREFVTDYANSDRFRSLQAETKTLKADLSSITYCLLIKGNRVQVRKYESEPDYSVEIEETFAKFKQGAVKDYRVKFSIDRTMNHVEAYILDLVAKLYPDIFSHLDEFYAKNSTYRDATIINFDREIQFYLAYLEYIARFKKAGLHFCYPQLSATDKDVSVSEGFDIALATKLVTASSISPVVCNDFYLHGRERIVVVTGPNQGGKTTFARAFGQLHYLASLGCPVPAREARLFLFDRLFTHFEKEEAAIADLRGKLQDELVRIHHILEHATPNSIVILNEMFTSTTIHDAIFLSKKIMERLLQLDVLCVWVTFIDELASLGEQTVSMVSTVVPENPAVRTFKIIRKPADGLAYAKAIAEKYRLTYEDIKERIRS
jgi:DNA mismatch repair protein MutS